ncbi:uncharacterized mitochondrial protein AtMg00860-like [Cannabis sativa]|uniref:uncharacterized mitochondrial protein AtMg00860-like n=1 Tax=Cannabis sativa TaxID=3483 RepID=UPI0011DF4350|nr:uncharacterized mitochondrial protein AtMg00860-like [Cannabis sativa]
MTKIYGPILEKALIYIVDILLFSPDAKAHQALLVQFASITRAHGIMLSKKKMIIGQTQIEFLGMKLSKGQYEAQPHIAHKLLKFPDENLTKVQVLQFLGIINYLRDFVPRLSVLTRPLSNMLKKNSPEWSHDQTVAVRKLKEIMQNLPPL